MTHLARPLLICLLVAQVSLPVTVAGKGQRETASRPFRTLVSAMVPLTYYVRSDGHARCTGLVDAADTGAGSNQPCAKPTLAEAITLAVCTDTIKAKAGQTFDGAVALPDKGCGSADPITITSTATLPSRRMTPADASLMPRFRTTNSDAVFTGATNAGGWTLDGLEITDNAGTTNINALIDFGSTNTGITDIGFTRNYVHQKETGTNYERSAVRVMIFNGVGLNFKWNYVEDFIGYPYGSTEPHNSESLLTVAGSTINFEDNYSAVWYNHIFLGGGDTASNHSATLSSASTTSAVFSGGVPPVGTFVRFAIPGTATLSNSGGDCPGDLPNGNCPTLTRLTGPSWVDADGNQNGNWGDSMRITSQADSNLTGIVRLMNRSGDEFTTIIASSSAGNIPNGTVDYILYQTARVTNLAGTTVTYDPQGTVAGVNYNTNALNKTPSSAVWNEGDEGRIVDVTVLNNTLHNKPVFAAHLQSINRGCPKGIVEVKNVDRLTFQKNKVTGYPAVFAMTAANQNGTAPWIKVDHVLIRDNWFHFDTGYQPCVRTIFLISDDAYLNTISPTTEVTITNNLGDGGIRSFAHIKQGGAWTLTHNTIINSAASDIESAIMLTPEETTIPTFVFKDNIVDHVCYGIQFYSASYPSRTILNNVMVDASPGCSGGIATSTYGTGSVLGPPAAFSGVGFTNQAAYNYLLTDASTYKNAGSDGTDPGVVWNTSGAPWLQVTPSSRAIKGVLKPRGTLKIRN